MSSKKTIEGNFVISGIAGRYPGCRNVNELKTNLYNNIDMVNDCEARWSHAKWPLLPKRKGVMADLEKFDASFFGVNAKHANALDPQTRFLLELAIEAIFDAGIHPETIRGSRTNVYIAQGLPESFAYQCNKIGNENNDAAITATCSSMMAGRLVYHLDLIGSAITLDTACSGSLTALHCAYQALRLGECDAALVGASNLLLSPTVTSLYNANNILSKEGCCRSLDEKGNGYARSEAVVMIFLQRQMDAKRIYANVLHVDTLCDGFKQEGVSHPSVEMQTKLLTRFYDDIGLNPKSLAYIEGHLTGTIIGDPIECGAIDNALCSSRDEPLLIGSIKSNIGHAEAAAGLCGITKVLLSLETGFIPPNLHFDEPNHNIPSLLAGRLKVVCETTPLSGPLCAISACGFSGTNGHCLLRQWSKIKVNGGAPEPDDQLPRLVNWAGRTNESISNIFEKLTSMPMDAEFIGLLHETQESEAAGFLCRGYGIFDSRGVTQNAVCITNEQNYFNEEKRPVVWLFPGIGSQWCQMGESIRQIEIARNAIDQCHDILLPFGLDLWSIITATDPKKFDNILNSFVGIGAIQIALVHVLRAVALPIDYLIGHSVGELVCSYADGSLSLEQAILCSYWRGKISLDEVIIDGQMAAVGLSYDQIKDQLPNGVYVACHNSSTSCTLSGPRDAIEQYVAELHSKSIFAKLVNTSGIPYHSKYIHGMKRSFFEKIGQTIIEPKERSAKWLSTSVPEHEWHLPTAKYSSAAYHLNNLLNPVLFEEALRKVPQNAIIVEIAPYGLLQAIMKRELPNAIHIPMMQKFSNNNSVNILKALGRIFMHGIPLRIKQLYPPIQFPVSRGTPMIAPLIKWDHGIDFFVSEHDENSISIERKIIVNISDKDSEYMSGHIIDGRCLLPAMSYLRLVHESFVYMTPGATLSTTNVQFENVKLLRATKLAPNTPIQLNVAIHRGNGQFEVTENNTAIVSGIVKSVRTSEGVTQLRIPVVSSTPPTLKSDEFYKELRLRGYMYDGDFRAVKSARADGRCGRIEWKNDNWPAFMDAMLQVSILSKDSRALDLPIGIRQIKINVADHLKYLAELRAANGVDEAAPVSCHVHMSPEMNTVVCGGIEITGMMTNTVLRRNQTGTKVLGRYEFVPFIGENLMHTLNDAADICAQLMVETLQTKQVNVLEVLDRPNVINESDPIIEYFQSAFLKMPSINCDLVLLTQRSFPTFDKIDVQSNLLLPPNGSTTVIIATNLMDDRELIAAAARNLIGNGFCISIESNAVKWSDLVAPSGFQLISLVRSESISMVLMQRVPIEDAASVQNMMIQLQSNDFAWLNSLQTALAVPAKAMTLVSQGDTASGALGFVNCLRREAIGRKIQLVQIDDATAPTYDCNHSLYAEQLKLGLPINIYRNGLWGAYRHMTILPSNVTFNEQQQSIHLAIQNAGDLSSLIWTPAIMLGDATNATVNVHYAALNFRDLVVATGRLKAYSNLGKRNACQTNMGYEFSGVTPSGKRIMGTADFGALANRLDNLSNRPLRTWDVPDNITLREAATIPLVYITVYYAFFTKTVVRAGQSILIHAGAGGVGLAAIRVALAYGLRVFTTVSSQKKRDFLLREFVGLKDNHIGYSRDCSFEQMIMDETNGDGVDYVLNSLAEDKLKASVRCLRYAGTLLEIGKFDIENDTNLGMRLFEKEITIRAVFADRLYSNERDTRIVEDLIATDLLRGIVRPLPSIVFAPDEIEEAFRYFGRAKHIGKVLIQMRESEEAPHMRTELKIYPKIVCNPTLVYVIVGGLGGFGIELADWLVIRGAQNLVLNSRRGITNAYQLYRINVWKSYGCKICISNADTTERDGCKQLLNEAHEYGHVGGIFNLAVVLSDRIFENQTEKSFNECLAPKAIATQQLDELSRRKCPKLEHFVVFSSVACGLGNAGQTNYGMANSIMERIIERRVRDKLPGKAIQWGAVGDVGIVAEKLGGNNDIEVLGTMPQRIDDCLHALDKLMLNDSAIVMSLIVPHKQHMEKLDLVGAVLSIIGITDIKSVSINATLPELGVDSLMNTEIKQLLEREYDIQLSTEKIRLLTVKHLSEMSAETKSMQKSTDEELTSKPMHFFDSTVIAIMGDESTKDLNIVKANTVAEPIDNSDACVLFIPGIGGIASDPIKNLCQRFKMPAYVLQLHTAYKLKTVDDVMAHVANDILKLHENRKRFCIAAYSFGTILATEVAKLLEKTPGRRGHIYLIDGNSNDLHKYIDSEFGCHRNRTDGKFETKIVEKIWRNCSNSCTADMELKMANAATVADKIDICIDSLLKPKYSRNYVMEYIHGMVNRCVMIENAFWNMDHGKIDAAITLIQANQSVIVDGEHDIARLTNGKTTKLSLSADHETILNNDALIDLIV